MITLPGPSSALVTLPVPPDGEGIARVLSLERAARDALPGVRNTIPAFNSLLIEGTPRTWDPLEVRARLTTLAQACLAESVRAPTARSISLPVCYDAELAPDLEEVARLKGLRQTDVAKIHGAVVYTVVATGFAPGFAYLGDLDARISLPRRPSPRPRVDAGAVGIADRRTGVYPAAGPGGWRLIGRVPAARFHDAAERVSRFEPGGRVEFRSIGLKDFEAESS